MVVSISSLLSFVFVVVTTLPSLSQPCTLPDAPCDEVSSLGWSAVARWDLATGPVHQCLGGSLPLL